MSRVRRPVVGLLVGLTLLSGCGGEEQPEKLTPITPPAPADLCSMVPQRLRSGLETSSTADEVGDPTAACALSSAPAADKEVRAVVTWTQTDTEQAADDMYASQCRALDPQGGTVEQEATIEGAEQACMMTGKGTDAVTITALQGRAVLTSRWSSDPKGEPAARDQGVRMIEGVLRALSGESASG